ncbi:S8 family serine peptidase [Crocinitomicaceae bacterium CZZ-1]|uniref:S8 family serine peptidase n=1 Tax=Taishania pollutisoli TaxID=2766479 RepID=A0A8J6P5U0_9FLAO|nr:GEVED domain-containing protein [Taishania pollutisoli]MBC9812439.1 S8 family serine peptidase [Taishania pollutisoli]
MKHLLLFSLFSVVITASNCFYGQSAKTHFDNKPYVEGEFLIQLTTEQSLKKLIAEAPAEYKLEVLKFVSPPMRIWSIKFDHQAISHEGMQQWLYTRKEVVVADYNYYVQMRSTLPGDPSFTQQWHHNNTGQTGGTADADIDSDLAWDITTGGTTATGEDIVVCMVEGSGGNLNHQDLSPNRWINTAEIPGNGIDDDNNGYIDDYNGWNTVNDNDDTGTGAHGTNCLGMIGAKGDNNLNVAGANWDVKLMVINMSSSLTQSNVIEAYTYPLVMRKRWNQSNGTQGAFVVATSASWGIDGANPASYPLWCQFYDTLGYHGIINIGATTNSNLDVDTAGDMPTACSSTYMVGVGRTDHNDNTAGGYGDQTIEFGAPGINVVTTAGTNGITTTTGTSFACPLTAGVVGLAYSIPCPSFMNIVKSNPRLGADLVLEALINGVDVKAQLATKFITGGRLNAKNTLDLLMTETCSTCFAENISVSTTDAAATITFTINSEVNSVNVHWRAAGASSWVTVTGVTSPYQLTGLDACSAYEFYLETTCTSETGESAITAFSTVGCGNCIDLPYCDAKATGSTQSRIAFLSPSGIVTTITTYTETDNWGGDIEDGYVYGNLVLMSGSGTNTNEGCGTLSNAAALSGNIAVAVRGTCNFSEKALNAQNAGATALLLINNQGTAPASLGSGTGAASVTIPVVMITQAQGAGLLSTITGGGTATGLMGVQHEWIESFALGGTTITSGDNNGYAAADGTNSFALETGTSYPFTLTPGFDGEALPEYTRIWLDANQNGTFETGELVFDQGSASIGAVSNSLTVPVTAAIGSTRMRVQLAYQGTGQTTLPNVCGDFMWGEVEDYCVTISEGGQDTTGVGLEQLTADDLSVFPNPSTDIVSFSWKKQQIPAVISIVDLVGKEMHTTPLDSETTKINVSGFATGTYLYRITGETGRILFTGKLLIRH